MSSRRTRLSHIGRPLDPSWPTNRAVLWLLPVGAGVAAVFSLVSERPPPTTIALAAALGAGVVFVGWALGRELAPDDQRGAFYAMALCLGTSLTVPASSLLLVVVFLGLVRVVNRTVGPPARVTDALAVLALVGWGAVSLDLPLLWAIAALAFAVDAGYPEGRPRQWGFATACVALMAAQLLSLRNVVEDSDATLVQLGAPSSLTLAWAVPVAAAFAWVIARTRSLDSVADLTEAPLSVARVRAGMVVALLGAAQSLALGDTRVAQAGLLWAVLAGVSLSACCGSVAHRPNEDIDR